MIDGVSTQMPIVSTTQPTSTASAGGADAPHFLQLLAALAEASGSPGGLTLSTLAGAGKAGSTQRCDAATMLAISDMLGLGDKTNQTTPMADGEETPVLTEATAEMIMALLGPAAALMLEQVAPKDGVAANADETKGGQVGAAASIDSAADTLQGILAAAQRLLGDVPGPDVRSDGINRDAENKLLSQSGKENAGLPTTTPSDPVGDWQQKVQSAAQWVAMAGAMVKAQPRDAYGDDKGGSVEEINRTAKGAAAIAPQADGQFDRLATATIVVGQDDEMAPVADAALTSAGANGQGATSQGQLASNESAAGIVTQLQQPGQAAAHVGARQADGIGFETSALNASVVDQIVRRAHLLVSRGRSSGLSIQLEPRELGRVQVYVSDVARGLHVQFAAEAQNTTELINAALPQLKAALESQGVRVDSCEVSAGLGFSTFGSPQDGGAQPQGTGTPEGLRYLSRVDETEPLSGSGGEIGSQSSLIDYRI